MLDLEVIERKLKKRRAELLGELREIADALDDAPPQDWEDRSAERQGDEVLEALGQHDKEEVRRIDAALFRIVSGTYGECQKCGEAISPKRLEALPDTPFCARCAP